MNLRLPKNLMDWVMREKGDLPPQAYIVKMLEKQHSNMNNTTGDEIEQDSTLCHPNGGDPNK